MKKFTIERGRHYCNWFWTKFFCPRWNHNRWKLGFTIPKSNWVSRIPGETINKLYGVGFSFDHHKNSWRLGWKYNFEKEGVFEDFMWVGGAPRPPPPPGFSRSQKLTVITRGERGGGSRAKTTTIRIKGEVDEK